MDYDYDGDEERTPTSSLVEDGEDLSDGEDLEDEDDAKARGTRTSTAATTTRP